MEAFAEAVFHGIVRATFPDETPNIVLKDLDMVEEHPCEVVYFSQYHGMREKKEEELIIFVLAETRNVERLTVVDMFDPLATMEPLPPPTWMRTFGTRCRVSEAESRCVAFYMNPQVYFRSGVELFKRRMQGMKGYAIAFPDEGAYKRFGPMFPKRELVVCGKRRVVNIVDGVVANRDVVIVDDLVH